MSHDPKSWNKRVIHDPVLWTLGGVVFVVTLIVYLMTVQRSLSFWDCGEFITCSYILGVPHPPGTPLFVLFGRIFSILPLVGDISFRVNLLSVFSGAFAAYVAYFVLARLITLWYSNKYPAENLSLSERLTVYAGSFSGSLFFAFGATNWANSVEAEVYSMSMFLIAILMWLTLAWIVNRDNPESDRYLIAISLIAFLAIGIHMTVFLVMPPIFLTVILLSERLRRDWRFWVTNVVLALVMMGVMNFLWATSLWMIVCGCAAAYKRWGLIGIVWTALSLGAGIVWALMQGEVWPIFLAAPIWGLGVTAWVVHDRRWGLAFALILMASIGYSTHLYIPIRAHHDPAINENDPKTWVAFQGFLERKQYGSESMFQRALTRRGEWANQLGQHRRMGFWGFFDQQYGYNDDLFFPVFILGLVGIVALIKRHRHAGLLFLLLLLISSVGLVWYMNFADGTRYNPALQDAYLEVRDRDYFFTPAFVLFGMAIGLGGAAVVRWLAGGAGQKSTVWPLLGSLLICALPARAVMANFHPNDRSKNFLPYDYAYNLLMSADENAIMFTNGDNDTFPVWCLQEVYGIRKDVRIANLSLLNTHWYAKQMKNLHDVPMNLSDQEVERLVHYRMQDGSVLRVQDQLIDVILSANQNRYPINFAVTVTPSNRRYKRESIENHLEMIGLGYRLTPKQGEGLVDLDRVYRLLSEEFQFRGVADDGVYKNETDRRTVQNYASPFFVVTDTLRRAGRADEAEQLMRRAMGLFPDQWEPGVYLAQLFGETNQAEKLDSVLIWADDLRSGRERVILNVAYSYRRLEQNDRAEEIMKSLYKEQPDNEDALRALAQLYYDLQLYDPLIVIVENWLSRHPGQTDLERMLEQVRNLKTPSIDAPSGGDTINDTVTVAP